MTNPLLQHDKPVLFDQIKVEHIMPALEQRLDAAEQVLNEISNLSRTPSWANLIEPWEKVNERLEQSWSPVTHLNMVMNTDKLRVAYSEGIQKLTAFHSKAGQNEKFYSKVKQLKSTSGLSSVQSKVIEDMLLSFELSGVGLNVKEREAYKQRAMRLSELGNKFQDNVLDATDGWDYLVTDESLLCGLPESSKALLKQQAEEKNKQGWLIKLEAPSFIPVITYADNRDLRKTLYDAYTTRASDQGPNAGQWNNNEVMDELLSLKHQQAKALGLDNYAQLSLKTKMAPDPGVVEKFSLQINKFAQKAAKKELAELTEFANQNGHEGNLEAWDVSYYSERMKKKLLDFSSEALRPYFQDQNVIDGLLQVAGKLFDIHFEKDEQRPVWHEQAIYYRVLDSKNHQIAGFYLDIYARAHKQGGAWMDVCRSRHLNSDGDEVIPIAFLNCNFTPPISGEPSLLTHDEVETLFHEFGHGLHHMLTKINIPSVSGISGVEWDAVELPSQFLENWCWERESLDLFARHIETGKTIPADLFDAMNSAKNFGAGMMLVRQLEFGLFDLKLHRDYSESNAENWVMSVLDQVRNEISVVKPPEYTRFPNTFGHIFGGGYSSGYYSYLWAEQLSADAFSRFEEDGLFNQNTGGQFKKEILEVGGSRTAMESFKAFRGREPEIAALLRHRGVA